MEQKEEPLRLFTVLWLVVMAVIYVAALVWLLQVLDGQ